MHENNWCTIEFHITSRFGQMSLRIRIQIVPLEFLVFSKINFLKAIWMKEQLINISLYAIWKK